MAFQRHFNGISTTFNGISTTFNGISTVLQANPTGHYNLDLSDPYDRRLACRLHMASLEEGIARQASNLGDISQAGNPYHCWRHLVTVIWAI